MTVDLKLDKLILFAGDALKLDASFNVATDKSQVLLTVGIIRPDGATEYSLYLQKFQPTPPTPATPVPPFQGTANVTYNTKLIGIHKAFAHIYIYSDTQTVEEELTSEIWLIVLPTLPKIM